MSKTIWIVCILGILTSCRNDRAQNEGTGPDFKFIDMEYPDTRRDTSVVDDYFGVSVSDPYRWLEDDRSAPTKRWVKLQQQLTENYMGNIPYRDLIRGRLQQLWNHERFSAPQPKGDYYYYFKNNGLQNQDVLYRMESLQGPEEAVLNPNNFSKDGTAALGPTAFSSDGSLLAYQRSEAGSDWQSIYVKDLESGSMLPDTIRWVKFSEIAWFRDGFFYSRYPEPQAGEELAGKNEFHQLFYHKVGTAQQEDELIFADRRNPQRNVYAQTTDDERFLTLSVVESTSGNALYFRDLRTNELAFTPIVENFDNDFEVVGNQGNNLFLLTNHKASNNRLIRINTQRLAPQYWQEILPESEDILKSVKIAGNHLVAHYLKDAHSELRIFNLDGELEKNIKLPGYGTVNEMKVGKEGEEVFFEYTSFIQPQMIYRLVLKDFSLPTFRRPEIDFNGGDYVVKQVRYTSYDGAEVPMFIIHKKGLKLDGTNPALLYGYGGFNIAITPKFNRTRNMLFPVVLENGGVCAVPNIRGGGEFGKAWHKAGTLAQKQNVFNDFQAAAEYLISNNYTSAEKLAIHGASNGGLLVGACLAQRPDLFGVAIPSVGVLDMLRYHQFTIGWAWATDYGRSDDPDAFNYLYEYSPLHNLKQERYPATMITTADHDDRVVPAHSFKFGATLQANQQGEAPVLVRIESSAGHGAGKPTAKRIEEGADMLSFMLYNMKENVIYEPEN